ncbi:ankyrin repeat and protein kinase domain-containing protein 1-like isoform X1 [Pecten maximus]|uniref:ankyrin repeat and protein kinase domain-containing protein 1-like isoform X1 n=1 Tax=Pecten maximus TaxID=6579 RepID=UPI001458E261|nr:ankyrin repeat and protein kinase domain-containing protein 1-like isoform X1 [Pecten maximus]
MAENMQVPVEEEEEVSSKCPYTGIGLDDTNDPDQFDIKNHILQMTMAMNVKSPDSREFYQAVLEKDINVIENLLEQKKVDVNHIFIGRSQIQPWHQGCRAIHILSEQHKEEKSKSTGILQLLLKYNADVMQGNRLGDLAIHVACKSGNYHAVRLFLEHNSECKDIKNNHGVTPLIKAVFHFRHQYKKSCMKIVYLLVNAGCDVNLSPDSGISPLHVAVIKDKELTEILVKAGANVNAICKEGNSPLLRVMCQNQIRHDTVEMLLKAGADTKVSTAPGRTPLHIAVSKSDDLSVQHLLKYNADPNVMDMYHTTPLWLAVTEHNMKILPMLVAHGGDVNLRTESKQSLLTVAVSNGDVDMTLLLLKLGARLTLEFIRSENPLFHAIKNRSLPLVKILLQENCPTDYPPYCSPEVTAQMVKDLEILSVMVRAGAKFDYQTLNSIGRELDQVKFEELFNDHIQNVPTLRHMSILRVRKILGLDIKTKLLDLVKENHLPQSLVPNLLLSTTLRL